MEPVRTPSGTHAGPRGTVYLVGAGPGEPDLITVKGLRLLRSADVVAYDRLVADELLAETRPEAERIYVGKTPHGESSARTARRTGASRRSAGTNAITQDQINRLLVARAQEGFEVVRLKGGDPFVFGRGGEEALALADAGVPFEVVPGITSAVGVPAYAGIPVTHRKVASSFAVVTAHKCNGASESDWAALARLDTVILLMGVASLRSAVHRLLLAGRRADEPAAIIERGATVDQRVEIGPLAEIPRVLERAGIASPATVVVGDVVALRERIGWFAERDPSDRVDAPTSERLFSG